MDNGLLRKNESEEVKAAFSGAMGEGTLAELNIKTINAQREFLDKLAGVDDPEAKRKSLARRLSRSLIVRPQRYKT